MDGDKWVRTNDQHQLQAWNEHPNMDGILGNPYLLNDLEATRQRPREAGPMQESDARELRPRKL